MGQFSWISVDTKEPIYCEGASQSVFMAVKEGGNTMLYPESDYKGYGVFGGKDFYEAFADMNDVPKGRGDRRGDGIGAWYHPEEGKQYIYPQLFLGTPPAEVDFTVRNEDDPNQGWRTGESSDDDDD